MIMNQLHDMAQGDGVENYPKIAEVIHGRHPTDLVIAFAAVAVSDFARRFSADAAIKHTCMHSLAPSSVFGENEGGGGCSFDIEGRTDELAMDGNHLYSTLGCPQNMDVKLRGVQICVDSIPLTSTTLSLNPTL